DIGGPLREASNPLSLAVHLRELPLHGGNPSNIAWSRFFGNLFLGHLECLCADGNDRKDLFANVMEALAQFQALSKEVDNEPKLYGYREEDD
ncbi:unnamed protein product, partial [Amoebophrya sp. A25]